MGRFYRSARHGRLGFSLLEAIFAVLVFGIAMLGAFGLLVYGNRSVRATREQMYVSRVLETTLETVRNLSWSELTAQPASQTFDATTPLTSLFGKQINSGVQMGADFNGIPWRPTGTILVDSVSGVTDLRRVTIQVQYSPAFRNGPALTSSLVTYISRNGIDRR